MLPFLTFLAPLGRGVKAAAGFVAKNWKLFAAAAVVAGAFYAGQRIAEADCSALRASERADRARRAAEVLARSQERLETAQEAARVREVRLLKTIDNLRERTDAAREVIRNAPLVIYRDEDVPGRCPHPDWSRFSRLFNALGHRDGVQAAEPASGSDDAEPRDAPGD